MTKTKPEAHFILYSYIWIAVCIATVLLIITVTLRDWPSDYFISFACGGYQNKIGHTVIRTVDLPHHLADTEQYIKDSGWIFNCDNPVIIFYNEM